MNYQLKPLNEIQQWQQFKVAAHNAALNCKQLRIIDAAGLSIDLSAQRYSKDLEKHYQELLQIRNFADLRDKLFNGDIVNQTENKAAWHTELRNPAPRIKDIINERQRVDAFVRNADLHRKWRNIVHIGIGGSDWGVRLAVKAFGYTGMWRQVRFVSNIDGHALAGGLSGLNPHETLIVIASKSFTTAETLKNGFRALQWLENAGISKPAEHVVAITAHPELAIEWGVSSNQVFKLWDWVGGRFSIWSAVNLTIALAINSDVVAGMQSGAAAMDTHFLNTDMANNAPMQMALSGIVNRSVFNYGSLNLAPYDFRLADFIPYIQQLEMESLGKSVLIDGQNVGIATGPAIWGMPGTDAQHTFFQWLHQSSDGAPVDFIICQNAEHDWQDHHQSLLANCLAQREALLKGKSYTDALKECIDDGYADEQAKWLATHRTHTGGRPSNLIVLSKLSPYTLGSLIALYEHKIFTQAVIWGINPFDQWGVEYGKNLAQNISNIISNKANSNNNHDISTAHWLEVFKN